MESWIEQSQNKTAAKDIIKTLGELELPTIWDDRLCVHCIVMMYRQYCNSVKHFGYFGVLLYRRTLLFVRDTWVHTAIFRGEMLW